MLRLIMILQPFCGGRNASREYLLDLRDSMSAIASSSSIGHRTRSRLNPSNLNVNKAANASVINYSVSALLLPLRPCARIFLSVVAAFSAIRAANDVFHYTRLRVCERSGREMQNYSGLSAATARIGGQVIKCSVPRSECGSLITGHKGKIHRLENENERDARLALCNNDITNEHTSLYLPINKFMICFERFLSVFN